jgi:hypothetical protein
MPVRPITFGDEGQVASREMLRRFDALQPAAPGTLRARLAIITELGSDPGVAWLGSDPGLPSDLIIGVALWAIRHEVPITMVEPVVNALAERSNNAKSKQELAAVYGLMQGVIAHVRDRLSADLERSNPERPWRLLHANFAITAIRTEDPELIDFAFDALDLALPDERANFYSEALALALSPRIPAAVRERIEKRHLKWASQ